MKPTFCTFAGCRKLARHRAVVVDGIFRTPLYSTVCDLHRVAPSFIACARNLVKYGRELVFQPFDQRRPAA